ncbi:LacI family DNA-binding transcriptional regulator [Herbiconiux ginsengi]|uniref:Transcriptional regulator, LacI family n=1 Tax=Herbiconiux ginsengi TaxID=381665 RepID=A0A1H3MLI0_9MICO|nr:substrate-binding domain-containing protein [Herbiconiux ginsengi]SDY77527.1 transcriptional regulator, LacI family [Herbiconiux ginsengi]
MARVGIRDVAALAGVAVGTVSHYLNHPDRVSHEKALRIRSAIDTLGFVPSSAGRQLRLGISTVVGYLAPDVSNPYFAEIAESIERRASELGMSVLLANSHRDREREDHYLQMFEEYRVRGLIVSSHQAIEERLAGVRQRGTPSVLVGQAARSPEQVSVSLDDVDGGRQVVQHLLDLGHRRIAFIGGPLAIPQVADRLAGASAAIESWGTASLEVIAQADRTIAGGRDVGRILAARPADVRPEAVFAANDLLALGIMHEFVAAGLRIPQDIAVAGYDDIEFAASSLISLTSVQGRHAGYGFAVVDMLTEVMAGHPIAEAHRVFTPELVVRESTVGRG